MNEHSDRQWCLRIQHFASCHSSFTEKMVLDTANGLTILSWGPGLWAWEAWAISNSLPPGKQASKASQIDACLLTSISRKERGLIDSARMTYITRQASRGRKHPPVETNVPVSGRRCKAILRSHQWWLSQHANSCHSTHPSVSTWPSSVSNKEGDGRSLIAIHHKLYFPVWVRQGEMMTEASLRYNLSFLCFVLEEDIPHDITFQIQRST